MTSMTPQGPIQERPPVAPAAPPPAPSSAPPTPQWLWNAPPNVLPPYPVPSPLSQASAPTPEPVSNLVPTPGQRLALAVTSLALFIPLEAILLNFAAPAPPLVPVALSIAAGLIGTLLLGLVVVGVNVVFNWDLVRPRR